MWHISKAMITAYGNSPSSQGREAESSAENCLDGKPCAPSKSPTTRAKSCKRGKMMGALSRSQSGTTLPHSGQITRDAQECLQRYAQTLIDWSSAEDSPVKTYPLPENAPVLTAKGAGCGRSMPGLLASYDPSTHSLKTAQTSWLSDLTGCCVTLPRSGTMRNGRLFQRPPLAQSIGASGFGYLPPDKETFATPTTFDSLPPKSPTALLKEATQARPGRAKPANLRDQVGNADNWPTPQTRGYTNEGDLSLLAKSCDSAGEFNAMAYRAGKAKKDSHFPTPTVHGNYNQAGKGKSGNGLATSVKLFPTPRANEPGRTTTGFSRGLKELIEGYDQLPNKLGCAVADSFIPTPTATAYKGWHPNHNRAGTDDRIDYTIEREASQQGLSGYRLNPDWVELLMGWPKGWTDLEAKPNMDTLFEFSRTWRDGTWEADTPRVTQECKNRANRIKAIGNGQVPQCAAMAFLMLIKR